MPLLRFHRGKLEDSLKTTIIVKTFNEMVKAIIFDHGILSINNKWAVKFEVKPYPSGKDNFDFRIGWYTQIVTSNILEEKKMCPIGFLSEPF